MKRKEQERLAIQGFLKSVDLFKKLSPAVLTRIANNIQEKLIRSHEALYYKGESSENIYIIRYGEILLENVSNHGNVYIGSGQVLAENSLISSSNHSTSAIAVIDTLVYVLNGKLFLQLAAQEKVLSQNIIHMMGSRMREHLERSPNRGSFSGLRRLCIHIPLEPEYHFGTKIDAFLENYGDATKAISTNIPISKFIGMDPTKISEYLTDVRKKTPLVHIYFDEGVSRQELPYLVVQADFIVFWEQEPEKFYKEKEEIVNFWKGRIRNFQGRAIRLLEDGVVKSYLPPDSDLRTFYQKDTLARYVVSKTRGLALGGGGARALAHVGLLKVLHREGIHFDFISGASMGAVIAALYARKEPPEKIEEMIKLFFGGLESAFDPTLPIVAFFKGKRMKKMLKEAFRDQRIEELPLPFATSAVDLLTGQEHIFDQGPITEALTSAMSLPGAFPPYRLGEKVLVDGGMINNVPESLIRSKGADVVLGVNVSPLQEMVPVKLFEDRNSTEKGFFRYIWDTLKYPPILQIMTRTITLEGREITRLKRPRMDLFVHFHLEEFQLFDFVRYQEIIDKGEKEAEDNLVEIKRLFA
ncbi:patatin-like phospholipase family protein [Leptospira idonii]|uniref:Alpha/beta hydrolase n=1 Tax=Leptospira idonii TaxID=1193500 RepID=A0A4R9M369_9LEPT|nr:patatin-like phospholipase family protein [Leptospira idonii]TGN20431.1 alpha/beta hydrolase [Leptospira idonii]